MRPHPRDGGSRGSPWRWVVTGTPVLMGLYLLAWAWRWPHSDLRNLWAAVFGVLGLVVGIGASAIAWSTPGRRVLVVAVVALAVVVVLWAFSLISHDQQPACGTALDACRSLLPGL